MGIAPDGTHLKMTGPEGAPVVVMIHGLGLNQDCWQWTIPALSDRFRVLTYDLYGHGQSAPPPERPSLSMFSRQLESLLDHCAIQSAVIAGFSLGGMIARRFAQDVPQRVSALVILHSPHKRTDAAQEAILKRVEQARLDGPKATVEAALDRWFTEALRQSNPRMMNTVRDWVMANDKATYHTIYRVLADGIDEIVAPSPPISCPALVITGDEDFGNGPEMANAIASEIAGGSALILPGLRHMALAEDPDAVNKPLRSFLNNLDLKP
ncbi:alpha/beta fold hydrolase [Ruegeria sp. HKCCA5763]|uniref:alpha/beta fold hydrolase n=1 Tax=Ruegeria sp. HKCCA5763 TaxID=2682987 RepID=UPI00147B3C02|nr:alpha/beta hydrolase [Ruegeria sp. HKCCA5763]